MLDCILPSNLGMSAFMSLCYWLWVTPIMPSMASWRITLIIALIIKRVILLVGGVLLTKKSLLTSQSLSKLLNLSPQLFDLYITKVLLSMMITFAIRSSSALFCHKRLIFSSTFLTEKNLRSLSILQKKASMH